MERMGTFRKNIEMVYFLGYAECLDEIKLREQVGRQKSHIKVFLYPWKFGRKIIHNNNSLLKITQIL